MKRSGINRKTPLKRGNKRMARSRPKKKLPAGGFPEEVRMAAKRRSRGICEAGSSVCTRDAAHFHHRKLRRFKDHSLINCLHVCPACHTYIHDEDPAVARMMGWLLNSWQEPSEWLPMKGERWNQVRRPQR